MAEKHDREWYENYAREHGYELTDIADRVIEGVHKCEDYCPCRYVMYKKKMPEKMKEIKCPCIFIEEDMKETKGHTCHCHLFKKKENNNG